MASRRNRKRNRRRSSTKNTQETNETAEPKYVMPCKQLLNQITGLDDSKPFHTLVSAQNRLYNDYRKFNSKPISFKQIRKRLYQKPCCYSSYNEFNEDVEKIFYQESRLKNYKGKHLDLVKKRVQNAKRTENYWKTLTASYTQYGFEAIINAKSNETDDRKEGENRNKSKKQQIEAETHKKNKKVLSNIKKRVRGAVSSELEAPQPPSKRRRLNNDNRAIKPSQNKEELDDEDDAKQELDENREEYKEIRSSDDTLTESPFTPFAEKSRVFNDVMGNTDDLFTRSAPKSGIKKRLHFQMDANHNKNYNYKKHEPQESRFNFEIKWRYNDSYHHREPRYNNVPASRMDDAVKQFKKNKSNEELTILSVKLISDSL